MSLLSPLLIVHSPVPDAANSTRTNTCFHQLIEQMHLGWHQGLGNPNVWKDIMNMRCRAKLEKSMNSVTMTEICTVSWPQLYTMTEVTKYHLKPFFDVLLFSLQMFQKIISMCYFPFQSLQVITSPPTLIASVEEGDMLCYTRDKVEITLKMALCVLNAETNSTKHQEVTWQ